VQAVFDDLAGAPAGTLDGTFTTDDAATSVTAVDLTSSSNGAFVGHAYQDIADIDADWIPQYFRLTVLLSDGDTDQLQLWFGSALDTAPDAAFAVSGYEAQQPPGSGNRVPSGVVTVDRTIPASVPEPQAWAPMTAGFWLMGAALRRRRSRPLFMARPAAASRQPTS
jgi:hypothetical protein